MLQILVPGRDYWDENKEEFVSTEDQKLNLEHSLVSVSKWESKWKKPYLTDEQKTLEETIDYIKCMTITSNVDPDVYNCLTEENIRDINAYIADPMTATKFKDTSKSGSGEFTTAETIYYWMISLNIPWECQKWHLNKLLALVKMCNIKNNPGKKMGKSETINEYAALNAARRAKMKSKG